jgi:hypothetical protein
VVRLGRQECGRVASIHTLRTPTQIERCPKGGQFVVRIGKQECGRVASIHTLRTPTQIERCPRAAEAAEAAEAPARG